METSYPQHEKMILAKPKSEIIGEFLEWLMYEKEYLLCQATEGGLLPIRSSIELTLAEYFEIDLAAFDAEKDQMLRTLRGANSPA